MLGLAVPAAATARNPKPCRTAEEGSRSKTLHGDTIVTEFKQILDDRLAAVRGGPCNPIPPNF
jgi:hypothetical protein